MKIQPETRPPRSKKARPPLSIYLAYLFVFTLLLTGVSFSYYTSTSAAGDRARVAGGILTVEDLSSGSRTLTLSEHQTEASWEFSVSNATFSGEVSQISFGYDVIVWLDGTLPSAVTVSLDGHIGTPASDFSLNSDSSGCTMYTFENVDVLQAGVFQERQHNLCFDAGLAMLTETSNIPFTITVRAEQID